MLKSMLKKTIDQKIDELARMTQRGLEDIRKDMATKQELRETEEHLLDAIRGIEVKKRDFDALADIVQDLAHRLSLLEKRG